MRKLLFILFILFSLVSEAQPPVQRSNATFTAVDMYWRASKSAGLPIYTDTANFSGLDSLGTLIYVIGEGMYLRDTITNDHVWVLQNGGGSSYNFYSPLIATGSDVRFDTSIIHTSAYNEGRYLQNITGKIIAGTNVSLSGSGTALSPYTINATSTGIATLNTLTASTQFFAIGSSGTSPSWSVSGGNTHSLNLPTTSGSNTGLVTPTLYNTWNAKQDAITGGATTILSSNLTSDRALISSGTGKVAVSSVTTTELGYVSGATSNLQTQINTITNKAFGTLTDGATVTWDYSSGFDKQLTIGGNRNITITNMSDGDYATLFITQDATGGRDITFTAGTFLLDGIGTGSTVDLTNTPNALDILTIVKRGSILYVTSGYFHN